MTARCSRSRPAVRLPCCTASAAPTGRTPTASWSRLRTGTSTGQHQRGDPASAGTVFKITPVARSPRCTISMELPAPPHLLALIQAHRRRLLWHNGDNSTIFRITSQGTLSTLYTFPGGQAPMVVCCRGTTSFMAQPIRVERRGAGWFQSGAGADLVPVTPCRLVDTRNPDGPFGGPAIPGNTSRSFDLPQNPNCNIPASAAAYSLNVTVVPHGPLGYLDLAHRTTRPVVSTMNSPDGRIKANAAIVPAGLGGPISVYVTDTTDVVLDIDGYFAGPARIRCSSIRCVPCRVVDTRKGSLSLKDWAADVRQPGDARLAGAVEESLLPRTPNRRSLLVQRNGGA